mmetsp:Transcript_13340/g.31701  ORF Transcript_13340/g.31701 Transcript_13340/m.31701 type:complete len:821 (+) Transcript_13340:57-2519(+)
MEPRQLSLTVPRVEVKTYRRVCTAADRIQKPAHFIYHLRCTWSGLRRDDLEFGSEEDLLSQQRGEAYWWDSLPGCYVVKRKWCDIQRLHNLVDTELAFDKAGGYRRVKTRMPRLPHAGELDAFLVSLAATGDVMALSRRRSKTHGGKDAFAELDLLHTIYVDNRLKPYFAELNKVLAELPAELLQECVALRNFVTSGVSCRKRQTTSNFFGRGPHMLEPSQYISQGQKALDALRAEKASDGARSPRSPQPGSPATRVKPHKQDMPLDPASRRASLVGGLGNSLSMPDLDEVHSGSRRQSVDELRTVSREEGVRFDRLAASHYGFFALKMSQKDLAPSSRDYWQRMALKEKKEMGRRALLLPPEAIPPPPSRMGEDAPEGASAYSTRSFWLSSSAMSMSQSMQRLPSLPPPGEVIHQDGGSKRRPAMDGRPTLGLASLKPLEKIEHLEVVMRDLCEGFQVCLLGEAAPQVPRSMRLKEPVKAYRMPGREETMKVYRVYCNLLQMEGVDPAGGNLPDRPPEKEQKKANPHMSRAFLSSASKQASAQARRRQRRHATGHMGQELARISWPSILGWAQHLEDISSDFRYRSVTAALNRALHTWRKKQATPRERSEGVNLSMMIQWTWPDIHEGHLADMMQWIFESELDKFKLATPRLIDPHERRILEALFHKLDEHGVGSCAPEDIAGGEEETDDRKENIVDVETVKAVVGEDRVELLPFLELMCESGVRAHEGATEVLLADGRKLVLMKRAVGGQIWVFDGTPADEEQPRRVADVFEAEVLRWRALANEANANADARATEEEAEEIFPLFSSDSEEEPISSVE